MLILLFDYKDKKYCRIVNWKWCLNFLVGCSYDNFSAVYLSV